MRLLPCLPPQIIGANTVEISFDDTEVKLAGGLQGWLDSIPRFSLPKLPDILQVGACLLRLLLLVAVSFGWQLAKLLLFAAAAVV